MHRLADQIQRLDGNLEEKARQDTQRKMRISISACIFGGMSKHSLAFWSLDRGEVRLDVVQDVHIDAGGDERWCGIGCNIAKRKETCVY